MKYHFRIKKENKGYSAKCIELEGCVTQADSKKKLEENMKEALHLYLEEPIDSKQEFALPEKRASSRNIIAVEVEPGIAFAVLMRNLRLSRGLTQKQAAARLGLKNLYSYQRLESAKANPQLKTLQKVKQTFPELELEYIIS